MTAHPVASGGFSSAAPTYARTRPTYARHCIGRLAELARESGPDARVLDVGAGTGILTGQLLRARVQCVAVEPLTADAAQLRRALPSVPAVLGVVEALPLRDRSVELVTAARSVRWFESERALSEASRVLASRGWLALVWNVRDDRVPWIAELDELVEARAGARPDPGHGEPDWSEVVAGDGRFEELITESFPNPIPTTIAGVLDRVRSTSFVATMEPDHRSALLGEVAELLSSRPELSGTFDYPNHTVLCRAQRR